MRQGTIVNVSAADRARLEAVVADRNSPQKHVWRARIVLLTAAGSGTVEIMRRTGKSKTAVWRWQERFMRAGVDGLLRDKTRPSRVPPLGSEVVERVVSLTQGDPPGETTHWTAAAMAEASGISVSSVQRIWRAHGLQPHRVRQFKLSNDPHFAAKLRDVVGLHVDPPAHAIVLSVDEKSQIQALDRTQPGLPLKPGRCGTMTHDYKRHGTTTLFAALDVRSGLVIGECQPRHRAKEFIRFLKVIDRIVHKHFDLHLIVDNYGTHKTPEVKAWLAKHPRFHLHFTPTSASWLNLVERFFAEITIKRIRRGTFSSVTELKHAIHDYLAQHNADPTPFVWTKTADTILAKERRALDAFDAVKARYQA
jgi:transposase